jgi:drug/metabolite transporter (DMT)-like permease
VKPLLEAGWSLGAALTARRGIAGLVLAPALVRALRRERGFLRRHGPLIAGFGLTGVLGCQLFYFSAMQRMPVAIALLIQYLAPVLLVGFVWLRTRRRPSALVLGGSLIAVAGLVLVVDVAGARFDLWGTLLALGAAVCAAVYFVISARAVDDLSPIALAAGGLLFGAAIIVLLGVTGILPFHAPAVSVVVGGVSLPWIVPVLWVAIASTAVGYALGVIAVPRIGSRLASFIGLAEVLFALAFAWLLLGETPGPVQFAGGALILLGVVAVRWDAGIARRSLPSVATAPAVPAP